MPDSPSIAGGVVQLPPYFRETQPTSFRAKSAPWHVADPELPRHWEQTGAGEGIIVGVADTGVDAKHQELQGRVVASKSFVDGKATDGNGHGTHVATTICGATVGVAPKAQIAMAKVLDDSGSGDNEGVADGIDWLVEQGCQIINLSLGASEDDQFTREAVQRAVDKGILVFAATGNERAKAVGYPAKHCIAVGAVDRKLRLADFSNRGKDVDVVGYGVDILAGVPGDKYQVMSGTSMATPWTAGVVANRLSAELKWLGSIATLSANELLRLEAYMKDLGRDGRDASYGRGFPDLDLALYQQLAPTVIDPLPGIEPLVLRIVGASGKVYGELPMAGRTA